MVIGIVQWLTDPLFNPKWFQASFLQLCAALLQKPQQIRIKISTQLTLSYTIPELVHFFSLKDEYVSQSQLMPSVTAKPKIRQCEWTRKSRHMHCWQQILHCENPSLESQEFLYTGTDEQQRSSVTDYLNCWA